MTDLSLDTRSGLPEPLRVLLEAHPRAAWAQDPGFGGLVQFWLDRHLMFRRLLTTMCRDTESLLDARIEPRRFAQHLSRHGGMFVNDLHGHHHIEDAHYFPVLKAMDARLTAGFDILDRDHDAMDGILHGFVDCANAALRGLDAGPGRDPVGALHSELLRLDRLLDRHLTDEEELVVPVILRHGTGGLG